ncbi:MAG: putative peptidoglycan lipid flippase [Blastocatellia bacterium]|nr:putative peptidoglycan lipid flippase [Blastocatellia bacterium]
MIKLSLILAGLAICNAVLAVLMPWYVVTHLGVGIETDAFFASGALPQLIFLVASFSLTQVLVPLLATEDENTFRRDAWGFFLGVTGFFSLLAAVLFVFAGYWVPLLVPGFSNEAKELTVSLSRIQLLGMVGNASVAVLWSVYYARQKFLWAELSPVFANVLSLLFLFWTLPQYGIAAAAWATVLNLVLKVAFLMPLLGRWQAPQWDSYAIREAWRRLKPFLLGQTYSKSDPLIDRFLTSMSIAGDLSLLYIGQQIYSAINLIITKAISAPTVPRLALAAKSGDWRNFRHTYRQRLLWMAGLAVATLFVLLVFGEPLLHLMIGHGGITAQNVHMLWWIMLGLIGLLMGGTAGQITAVAFYAMGDTKTPTMLFVWTFTIYIPIKVIVFLHYGLIGLAIATSVHLIMNFLLQLVFLEQVIARTQRSA